VACATWPRPCDRRGGPAPVESLAGRPFGPISWSR